MNARPILFSADMVRALLDGRKTQTRRIVKPQPQLSPHHEPVRAESRGNRRWVFMTHTDRPDYSWATGDVTCRYGMPGDLLWVRETHAIVGSVDPGWVLYRANGYENECRRHGFDRPPPESDIRWKPSIHMPRWTSRLTLRLTNIRAERLQAVSEADAIAEGIERIDDPRGVAWKSYELIHEGRHKGTPNPHAAVPNSSPVTSYRELWEAINGRESWAANPWVWVIGFDVIQANVDYVMKREAA